MALHVAEAQSFMEIHVIKTWGVHVVRCRLLARGVSRLYGDAGAEVSERLESPRDALLGDGHERLVDLINDRAVV